MHFDTVDKIRPAKSDTADAVSYEDAMMKKLLVFFALLLASPAFAQTIQQSGTVTARHPSTG